MQLGSESADGYCRQAVLVGNGDSGRDDSFSRQTRVVTLASDRIPGRVDSRPLVPEAIASRFRQTQCPQTVYT